jgi:hypothetical protein
MGLFGVNASKRGVPFMAVHKVFIADDEILIRTGLEIVINAEEDMVVVGSRR